MSDRLEEILNEWGRHFEPATGTRGQGGLPLPGSVTDWQLTLTKDGWKHHKTDLIKALQSYIDTKIIEARIDWDKDTYLWGSGGSLRSKLQEYAHRYMDAETRKDQEAFTDDFIKALNHRKDKNEN